MKKKRENTTSRYKNHILEIKNVAKIGNSYIRQLLGDPKPNKKKEIPVCSGFEENMSPMSPDFRPPEFIGPNGHGVNPFSCPPKVVYENERNKFKLYHKEMCFAPKSVLRMATLLPMFEIKLEEGTKNGYIPQVNFWELSQILNCSKQQVKFALEFLQKKGMIELTHIFNCANLRVYKITIIDYQKFYAPAQKGGAGYFELTKEKFHELINIKDVNELRIELARLIMAELQDENEHYMDFDDISYCLPPYARKKEIYIKKSESSSMFSVHMNKYCKFVIKSTYNVKKEIQNLVLHTKAEIENALFHCFGNNVTEQCANKIADMVKHFSPECLIQAIEQASNYHFNYIVQTQNTKKKKYHNLPAVIYGICRNLIYC